ncbi:hypothetical protein H0H92_004951 [Tricholoma furcatifolium]|nr:hypothetical protein H0H92_004951 [Tricholoma furcatifolium]
MRKEDVEDRIRRAQWAILNPTLRKAHGARHILTGNDHGDNLEQSFSSSYVSLQISGPEVPDLSFVDLPGLIAGVGMTGNSSDIDLVKNLVATYIKRPSCIILLTVACETDFQNQGAQEMAKIYDPKGKRTVGVLTKPDRIPTSEEPDWVSIIKNEKEPLENGWYCVKQPSSQQISNGMTWAQARKSEEEFFASTAVWSELDTIYQRLPEIQEEIDRSIANTRESIRNLPKPPSGDPRNEISTLLHNFVRDLAKHVAGTPTDGLLQAIRPAQENFRRSIRATAPDFQPFESRYRNTKKVGTADFLVGEEGHDIENSAAVDDGGSAMDDDGDDAVDDDGDDAVDDYSDDNVDDDADDSDDGDSYAPDDNMSDVVGHLNVVYIDEVLKRANEARTRELPGSYPFVVQETYIRAIINKWHEPAHFLCRFVFQTLQKDVHQLIQFHFGEFGQGQLAQRIKLLFQDHLKKCLERAEERIDWLVKLEDRPFTLNTHYLIDYKEKFLAHFRSAREKDRNPRLMSAIEEYRPTPLLRGSSSPAPSGVAKVLASLVEMGITGVKPESLVKLIEPDGMEPALHIMADVRAYFQETF